MPIMTRPKMIPQARVPLSEQEEAAKEPEHPGPVPTPAPTPEPTPRA